MDSKGQLIRIVAASPSKHLADKLEEHLHRLSPAGVEMRTGRRSDAAVYAAGLCDLRGIPDLDHGRRFLDECRLQPLKRLVWLSSSAVFHPGAHHPGLVTESFPLTDRRANRIAAGWRDLETLARSRFDSSEPPAASLTVLRLPPVVVDGGEDYFNCLLRARAAVAPLGYDPPMQFCSSVDVARAILAALRILRNGFRVYHVAPAGVIPLKAALRLAGVTRLPAPMLAQAPVRRVLSALGWCRSAEQMEYLRHNWTVDGGRLQRELGFVPRHSSYAAVQGKGRRGYNFAFFAPGFGSDSVDPRKQDRRHSRKEPPAQTSQEEKEPRFDDFGMDLELISKLSRTLFRFLRDRYWRIEYRGLENIPAHGAAVLVGLHRGPVPFDGIMILHASVEAHGRVPRFLIHPGLIKPPFFSSLFTKLGGVVACRENARRILRERQILGVFPEGVRGAFTPYRRAYRMHKFDLSFVRLALEFRAPIIPFATVGSAETFPILANLRWKWWMRRMEWPSFPLTPTFPWLPLPLPSKWHTRILPPMHLPASASDGESVRRIGETVRRRIGEATRSMLARRTSWFRGSVFDDD